jgi:glycosyltransferase 2 family protein
MESIHSDNKGVSTTATTSNYFGTTLRLSIGVGALLALYYFDKLDLRALEPLLRAPWTIAGAALFILLALPLAALRWAIILDVLGIGLPIGPLFRIVCISTTVNQFLLALTSGDALRGIYAWHLLRRASGRIAISIIADRAAGLLALLTLSAALIVFRWDRVSNVPALTLLTLSIVLCIGAALISAAVMLAVPTLLVWSLDKLRYKPKIAQFISRIHSIVMAFRLRLFALVVVFGLSLIIQGLNILAFVVIGATMKIGNVSLLDISIAAPLALVANVLPFTPGGLGIGEAAFDQICRWLVPSPASAPYASIFFAFRAVSMAVVIPGLISFVYKRGKNELDTKFTS